jgi:prepilin peptidase CpaA
MNLVQLAPIWLVAILGAALIAAAVEDVARLRVSNIFVLVIIATAGVAIALAGWSLALWQNLLIFALLLAVGTMLFAARKVGGGDVKLFAAVGLWMDLERALMLVAAVSIAGGLIALLVLLPRLIGRRSSGPARERSKMLPYAVAIAAGALFVIASQRYPQPAQHPDPLEFSAASLAER